MRIPTFLISSMYIFKSLLQPRKILLPNELLDLFGNIFISLKNKYILGFAQNVKRNLRFHWYCCTRALSRVKKGFRRFYGVGKKIGFVIKHRLR